MFAIGGLASANSGTITANGGSVSAEITTANQPSTWTFSGTSGEVVTASTTPVVGHAFTNACDVTLELLDPNGNTVSSVGCAGTSAFLSETTLPGAGTYTLKLVATNSDLGWVNLYLSANAANGTITANSPTPTTFTATSTGQGQEYAFTGKSNKVVTVSTYNGTFPGGCDLEIYLLDSTGNILASGGCASTSGFIAETTLTGKGTYYVDVVPEGQDIGNNTGHLTIALSSNPANATITANGAPVTFTATSTGQGGNFTFSGAAGEVITASTYNGTFPSNCDLELYLFNSVGTDLANAGCASQSDFLSQITLPGTGSYKLELQPYEENIGSNTGSVKLQLSEDAANSTITENGAAVTFTATKTGQGRNFTFKGKAGQVVTASTYGGTFPSNCDLELYLFNSGGTLLENAGCAAQSGFLQEITLPSKGTYTLAFEPLDEDIGSNIGSVTLSLSEDAANGTIAVNGPSANFTSTHTGQGQDYSFSGTAGESVTATTSAGTFPSNCDLQLYVISPNGTYIGNAGCAAQNGTESGILLPGTGTYTLELVPEAQNIGTNRAR